MDSELLARLNQATSPILSAAIEVHRRLGPGLLESVYTQCLLIEMERNQLAVETERLVPLIYRGVTIRNALRVDLVVGGRVIIEVKSVEHLLPVHQAQLLTYLKLAHCPTGLLLNFNVPILKDGIKRVINPAALDRLQATGGRETAEV